MKRTQLYSITSAYVILLGGCASIPGPMPELPDVQGFAILPNCIASCHIAVTVEKADSKIEATNTTGAVTGGAQSQSSSTSTTTTKTRSGDGP